jgi:4-hydroxy-tetrahydrodipicolinate synthase
MLQGTITALVTPMLNTGEVDFNSLTRLVELQITSGVSGLVIAGTTGEASTLSFEEKKAVITHVIDLAAKKVKIIVGMSDIATSSALTTIDKLNKIEGIDYVLVLTPAYIKPTQEGLYQHFMAIATASQRPIILYNVPGRTSCNLADDTAIRLANASTNIVGLKDATGDMVRCSYLVNNKPSNFALYSGDDATALAFNLCGGDGVISVVSNALPKQMSQMIGHAIEGNKPAAIELNKQLSKLMGALFIEANPIPIKWVVFHSKIITSPSVRLPLVTLSKPAQVKIAGILNAIP